MSEATGSEGLDDRFAPDLAEIVVLGAGETLRYPLVSAAGAGYSWAVQELEADGSAQVSIGRDVTQSVRLETPEGLPTNEQQPMQLIVRAVRPGRSRWRLRLIRAWAPDAALVDRSLVVVVQP